jgi:hypothetical protein
MEFCIGVGRGGRGGGRGAYQGARAGGRYGLGGSVWTNDLEEGERRIGEMESGNTWLNAHLVDVMAAHAPFGGIKTSVRAAPSPISSACISYIYI